ncbi:hypothetical protein [Methylobacter sp.]|uniref:hypothetical protein n=1 Tax=Methylobacter sp. TaxID=2051955 RepID=UPI0012163B69|nr:hypothetical protein [Methylobacter sp.]TAK60630.1 MAG: hypothetical protein EPO18_16695 [Methylobacter sp.]
MPESFSVDNLAESVGKILAVAGSVSFTASIIYDLGFYHRLGLSFLDVPSVLSDHVRSGLLWFPMVITILGCGLFFEMLCQRLEQGMTEQEILQSTSNPARTKTMRNKPLRFIGYISILQIILYFLIGEPLFTLNPYMFSIAWIVFSIWAQDHPRLIVRRPFVVRFLATLLPAIAILFYLTGNTEAARLFDKSAPTTQLTNSSDAVESVVLLRQLDKGILVRTSNGSITFNPWEEVKKIESPGKYNSTHGILCSRFSIICPSVR